MQLSSAVEVESTSHRRHGARSMFEREIRLNGLMNRLLTGMLADMDEAQLLAPISDVGNPPAWILGISSSATITRCGFWADRGLLPRNGTSGSVAACRRRTIRVRFPPSGN